MHQLTLEVKVETPLEKAKVLVNKVLKDHNSCTPFGKNHLYVKHVQSMRCR